MVYKIYIALLISCIVVLIANAIVSAKLEKATREYNGLLEEHNRLLKEHNEKIKVIKNIGKEQKE